MYNPGLHHYRQMNRNNLKPTEIITKIFWECQNLVREAKQAMKEERHEEKFNISERLMTLLRGLQSCLQQDDTNTDIYHILNNYYDSMIYFVGKANITNDEKLFDEIQRSMQDMYDIWSKIDQSQLSDISENKSINSASSSQNSGNESQNLLL